MEFHSINKAVVQIPAMCLYNGSDDATLLVLVGRGGGRKEKRASTACVRYMGVGQSLQPLQEASKRWCRFAAAIRPWEWPCCPGGHLLEVVCPPPEDLVWPRFVCASPSLPKVVLSSTEARTAVFRGLSSSTKAMYSHFYDTF
jgi:hypothetical protein